MASTGIRMSSKGWISASFMESSSMALEGGLRFGSTMVLPAFYGPDGATEVGWCSFSGGTGVWIDVELTDAMGLWLDDGGEGMAFRSGVGPFMASGSLVFIDGGSGVLPWSCSEVVTAARSRLQVAWLRLVLAKFQYATFGDFEAMAFWLNGLPYFSLLRFQFCCFHYGDFLRFDSHGCGFVLHFQFCCFHYGYCLRLGSHGWGFISLQVVATPQLVVGAWADDGGMTVAALWVRRRGSAGRRGIGFPRRRALLSAGCSSYHYFMVVLIYSCFVFPKDPCPHVGANFYYVCIGYRILCVLSAIVRWSTIIKWLLPPSVRMKYRVIKSFFYFIRLHEEDELVNSLLCLCVGFISSLDSCYFKTVGVANGALSVFRRKLGHMYVGLRSLPLLLRLLSYLVGVIIHEVRFMPPSLYFFC